MHIVYLQREFTNHIRKQVYVIIPFRKAIFHKKIFVWKQKGEFRHLGAMSYELNNE